jgi:putative sterol carrier protein
MTDGGKPHRTTRLATAAPTEFAPLRALLKSDETDLTQSLQKLSAELAGFDAPMRLQVQVLEGSSTHDWELECGRARISASRDSAKEADVRVVVRHDTWLQIAHGKLNPFDAFISGKLRVGGDVELAKRLVQHLSDPSAPYVSPC